MLFQIIVFGRNLAHMPTIVACPTTISDSMHDLRRERESRFAAMQHFFCRGALPDVRRAQAPDDPQSINTKNGRLAPALFATMSRPE
jgi:hypothetical protein